MRLIRNLIIAIVGIVFVYLAINQLAINTYDGATFSDNKAKSKETGAFISDFIPSKDSVKLLKRTLPSPDVWMEHALNDSHFLIFFRKETKDNYDYNLVFNLDKLCQNREFIFDFKASHQALNCIDGIGEVHRTFQKLDSFTLYIKQGSLDSGWQKELVVDSVVYIAKDKPKDFKKFKW